MRKNIILILIAVGIIVGDIFLYKIYGRIEYTRQSIITENYANERELYREIQDINQNVLDFYLSTITRS